MSTETIRLIRYGEKGVRRWGKREIIYLSLFCHHQNDSCIKMGSDVSHFNVSLIVKDEVTRQCPQLLKRNPERRAEADSNRGPSSYQPNALLLGQIGSHITSHFNEIIQPINWRHFQVGPHSICLFDLGKIYIYKKQK